MNITASAKLWPGPHSSTTFSLPPGETTNSLTCPTTTTWKPSQASPMLKMLAPRSKRLSEQPAASRTSSSSAVLENRGRLRR